jgi:hypothetical protein
MISVLDDPKQLRSFERQDSCFGSFATSACFEDVRFAPDSDREAGMTKSTLRAIERTRYRGNALRAQRRGWARTEEQLRR